MNPLVIIALVSTLLISAANCQTAVTTGNCPSGEYYNYASTAYTNRLSPVTTLAGVSYNSGGFYAVTSASGADQCCYNCATQTGGACTTWTYDGCGRCYLSSATGSSNYLYYSRPYTTYTGCGGSSTCTSYVSGFVSASSSSATTTTAAGVTTTTISVVSTCFIANDVNVATPPNTPNADTQITTANAQDCCNKCGQTNGCLGFAFLSTSSTGGACWLKYYNPFGSSTPTAQTSYPGIILGSLTSSG